MTDKTTDDKQWEKEFEEKFWRESVRSVCNPNGEKFFVGYLKDAKAFLRKALASQREKIKLPKMKEGELTAGGLGWNACLQEINKLNL